MVNLVRRKRQATDNCDTVFWNFINKVNSGETAFEGIEYRGITNECELDELIKTLEQKVLEISSVMEPDWAIPIIIEIIGKIYYGDFAKYKPYGNSFKRTLAYLWYEIYKTHGTQKNIAQLAKLIYHCYILEGVYSYKKCSGH